MISGGRNLISIWFFIGVLVLAYGILITGWALFVKPGHTWVLQELRADLWWGVLMTAIGAIYTVRFRPGRK